MSAHDHSLHRNLTPARLEAFSDGVFAIIITITVLELRVPHGSELSALVPLIPLFFTYAVSFQIIGTYWNNHHHLLKATKHVAADVMWANLNLLFWISLIPFATGWLGENHGGTWPTALYASVLFLCAIAYTMLQASVVRHAENRAELVTELNKSKKGLISLACYAFAIMAAFVNPLISDALIVLVAIMWFIPDRRIARFISSG